MTVTSRMRFLYIFWGSVPWHLQILADQLTLFRPGGTDFVHLITTGTPGFSDFLMALFKRPVNFEIHTIVSTKKPTEFDQGFLPI